MEIWNTYKTPEHRADFIEELEYRRIHGVARPKKVKPSNQPIGGPNGPQKDEEGWRPYGTKRALIGSSGGRNHLKDRLLEVGITPKILSDEAVLKKIRTERPLEVNHVNSSKPGQNPEWVYSFDELDGVKLGITIDRRNGGISTVYPTEMKREELKEYLDELYGG